MNSPLALLTYFLLHLVHNTYSFSLDGLLVSPHHPARDVSPAAGGLAGFPASPAVPASERREVSAKRSGGIANDLDQSFGATLIRSLFERDVCTGGVTDCSTYTCDYCGTCCGGKLCAPDFGQCCNDGTYCPYGAHCWIGGGNSWCCPGATVSCYQGTYTWCCNPGQSCGSSGACLGSASTSVVVSTFYTTSTVIYSSYSIVTITSAVGAASTTTSVVTSTSTNTNFLTVTSTSTITSTQTQNQARDAVTGLALQKRVPTSTYVYSVWSWATRVTTAYSTVVISVTSIKVATVFSTTLVVNSVTSSTTTLVYTTVTTTVASNGPGSTQPVFTQTPTPSPTTVVSTITSGGSTVIFTTTATPTLPTGGAGGDGGSSPTASTATSTSTPTPSPGLSVGAIAGIGAGTGVAALALLAALILFFVRRNRRDRDESPSPHPVMPGPGDPGVANRASGGAGAPWHPQMHQNQPPVYPAPVPIYQAPANVPKAYEVAVPPFNAQQQARGTGGYELENTRAPMPEMEAGISPVPTPPADWHRRFSSQYQSGQGQAQAQVQDQGQGGYASQHWAAEARPQSVSPDGAGSESTVYGSTGIGHDNGWGAWGGANIRR